MATSKKAETVEEPQVQGVSMPMESVVKILNQYMWMVDRIQQQEEYIKTIRQ